MILCSLLSIASAFQFYACEKCPDRIRISEDGKTAYVNTCRFPDAEKDAMTVRAHRLLMRGRPVAPADPKTPLMGWSSWNTFAEHISEEIIVGVAKAMATNGLKDAGYVYVNIDDGFFDGHGPDGRLRFNPRRFPNGMKRVVERIHALGMKAGTYSDAGANTCASYGGDKSGIGAGLYGYDAADCRLFFNELGFDFIKVDYCGALHLHLEEQERYTEIAAAIRATGRKDVRFNICRWAFPGTWAADIAGSWRTTCDIRANWPSVKNILAENLYLSAYASPGGFNDLDMLEVGQYKGAVKSAFGAHGDTGLTHVEETSHFGMWCILSSPLIIGCDVRNLPQTTFELVTNPYLLRMNQDPLGLQAYVVSREDEAYQLVKDAETLFGKSRYIALYNAGDKEHTFTVRARDFDLGGRIAAFDLVRRADVGTFTGEISVTVPPHGAKFYLLDAEKRLERTVYEAETAYLTDYSEIDESSFGMPTSYIRQGRAGLKQIPSASGGVAVVNLGGRATNDLLWKNVKVFNGGVRSFLFSCLSSGRNTFFLQIDGGRPIKIKVGDTGGKIVSVETKTDITAGVHTVRLFNPHGPMPDIDKMVIK